MPDADKVRNWTPERLPDLGGRLYVVTGGNSGIGLEAAKMLASRNADVIVAARNPEKARAAVDALASLGSGVASSLQLDLADLSSVRAAAETLRVRTDKVDGLVNNAGIMQTPPQKTANGFEMQFGTNHLGHFYWTGLLLDLVEAAAGRIVTVSSIAHRYGKIHFDDLMLEKSYDPTVSYCQSKLANLVFALELHRRLMKSGSSAKSIACHPGYSNTNLQSTGPGSALTAIYRVTNALFAQSAEKGAMPTVLAAAGDEARAGAYYGPTGFRELNGPVGEAAVARRASDEETGARLWTESERLVGLEWLS
ncbi:MAG: oxidoreductase [Pseudomonadota bacterium]